MSRIPILLPDVMQPVGVQPEPLRAFRTVTPTASPFTYVAGAREAIHITGGTLSSMSVNRGAVSLSLGLIVGGQTQELNPGDSVRIAYLTVPTITIIPR